MNFNEKKNYLINSYLYIQSLFKYIYLLINNNYLIDSPLRVSYLVRKDVLHEKLSRLVEYSDFGNIYYLKEK